MKPIVSFFRPLIVPPPPPTTATRKRPRTDSPDFLQEDGSSWASPPVPDEDDVYFGTWEWFLNVPIRKEAFDDRPSAFGHDWIGHLLSHLRLVMEGGRVCNHKFSINVVRKIESDTRFPALCQIRRRLPEVWHGCVHAEVETGPLMDGRVTTWSHGSHRDFPLSVHLCVNSPGPRQCVMGLPQEILSVLMSLLGIKPLCDIVVDYIDPVGTECPKLGGWAGSGTAHLIPAGLILRIERVTPWAVLVSLVSGQRIWYNTEYSTVTPLSEPIELSPETRAALSMLPCEHNGDNVRSGFVLVEEQSTTNTILGRMDKIKNATEVTERTHQRPILGTIDSVGQTELRRDSSGAICHSVMSPPDNEGSLEYITESHTIALDRASHPNFIYNVSVPRRLTDTEREAWRTCAGINRKRLVYP